MQASNQSPTHPSIHPPIYVFHRMCQTPSLCQAQGYENINSLTGPAQDGFLGQCGMKTHTQEHTYKSMRLALCKEKHMALGGREGNRGG